MGSGTIRDFALYGYKRLASMHVYVEERLLPTNIGRQR